MKHIWIVEMFENGKWHTTVGAGLTYADAVREKRDAWEWHNAEYKFRICKYVKQETRHAE